MASVEEMSEMIRSLNLNLKNEQQRAVESLYRGEDVLAVLPTGFGKSRIFQAFASLKIREMEEGATLLVISPLASIIEDQLADLSSRGFCAASLSGISSSDLKECKVQFFLSSAEETLKREFQAELKNRDSNLHKRLCCIVVDESHTVETWTGKRKMKSKRERKEPFRSAYGKLGTLRSLCKEGVPVLALTGTADKNTQNVICKELVMSHPTIIFISPNRENLRISVTKTEKANLHTQLDWLVDMVKRLGASTPKTIIFTNTLKDIAIVVNHLMVKLGENAFYPHTSTRKEDLIVGIFHSASWPQQKQLILKSLCEDGLKRIVVSSAALSMGVNFPDIRHVINWGPARTLLDHHQEAGRAGRDGLQAHVITVYHGQQLTHCEEDVKTFVKAEGCIRVAAYKPFDATIRPLDVGHKCCIHCARSCACEQPDCKLTLPFEKPANFPEGLECNTKTRLITEEDKKDVRESFMELSQSLPVPCSVFGKTASHGFSAELIESICENCHKLFTFEDINNCLPVYSVRHGLKILEILDEIFEDIPSIDTTMTLLVEDIVSIDTNSYNNSDFLFVDSDVSDPEYEDVDEMLDL